MALNRLSLSPAVAGPGSVSILKIGSGQTCPARRIMGATPHDSLPIHHAAPGGTPVPRVPLFRFRGGAKSPIVLLARQTADFGPPRIAVSRPGHRLQQYSR